MFILNMIPTSMAEYVQDLANMAGRTNAQGSEVAAWLSYYTVFYWAWWISWTPFVGIFIARISRGRTIRQFVTGVLLVPSLVSLVWFAVFGGSGDQAGAWTARVSTSPGAPSSSCSRCSSSSRWATAASVLVMVLVAIFFVSGADAASIVMGSLSQRGAIEPSRLPVDLLGRRHRRGGGGDAARRWRGCASTGSRTSRSSRRCRSCFVMVGLCVALVKDLMQDPLMVRRDYARAAVHDAVITGVTEHGDDFALSVEPSNGTGDSVSEEPEKDSPPP